MATVVIIRAPGNKVPCLHKSRDIGGEKRSEKKTDEKSMSKEVTL